MAIKAVTQRILERALSNRAAAEEIADAIDAATGELAGDIVCDSLSTDLITGTDASLEITGQTRLTTENGGAVAIAGAASIAGVTGNGGAASCTGGASGSTNGLGGDCTNVGGAGTGSGNGGSSSVIGGGAPGTGNGGTATVRGGATTGGATGTGGNVVLTGGGNGNTTNGAGGVILATGGAGKGTGKGGRVALVGGAAAGSADGGDVILTGGTSGSGVAGKVQTRGLATGYQPPVKTATNTATLTDAQILGGILVSTPTAAAAYTLRTGAEIEAALGGTLANNDSFDLTIINLGDTTDTITLTGGVSGITAIVGDPDVFAIADVATLGSSHGTFRFVRTAADTFSVYRVA